MLAALLAVLGRLAGFRPGGRRASSRRRAFLNGKLDLTAAEGLADLVDATSRAQARQALRQLDGELGRLYAGWRERLLTALALIEAEIDFAPDEEVPDAMLARVAARSAPARRRRWRRTWPTTRRGERLRAGVTVAVIGAAQCRQVEPGQPAGPARRRDRHRRSPAPRAT